MTGYKMYNRYIIFTCHYQQYNYTFRLHVKITEHNFTSFYLFIFIFDELCSGLHLAKNLPIPINPNHSLRPLL